MILIIWLDWGLRWKWLVICDGIGQVVRVWGRKLSRKLICSVSHVFRHVSELAISRIVSGRPRNPELEMDVNGRPLGHRGGEGK